MLKLDDGIEFEYRTVGIRDVQVEVDEDPKTGRKYVSEVRLGDEPFESSQRFWTSLFARYGIGDTCFKYFSHAEVFDRIAETEKNDRVRVCVEHSQAGSKLLGAGAVTRPIVEPTKLLELLAQYDGQNLTYNDGVIETMHVPARNSGGFEVLGDAFSERYMLSTPIDGYGSPNFYLSMLRLVCTNGVIGFGKMFKSGLNLGKKGDEIYTTFVRALEGFNNEEGFAALRQRIESATESYASVNETMKLYDLLAKLHGQGLLGTDGFHEGSPYLHNLAKDRSGDDVGSPILKAFHRMTGDLSQQYGLANLNALSVKKQQTLPAGECSVYEVINFATEAATHYAQPQAARQLNAFVGSLLCEDYDMEGTKDGNSEYADFLIGSKLAAGVTG